MPDSPEIYQVRKQVKPSWIRRGPEIQPGTSRTQQRPHQTVPPLERYYPTPWLPEPVPTPVRVCEWNAPGAEWNSTFYFNCDED